MRSTIDNAAHVMSMILQVFFGHASGKKSFKNAGCCEARLVIVRRHYQKVLLDARLKKSAIEVFGCSDTSDQTMGAKVSNIVRSELLTWQLCAAKMRRALQYAFALRDAIGADPKFVLPISQT